MKQQQPLPLAWTPRYDAHSFIVSDCNRLAYETLMHPETWEHPITLLQGPKGSGKTHLARIFQSKFEAIDRVDDLQHTHYVIDNADSGAMDEEALFHVYNHVLNTQGRLLVTMTAVPESWVKLPDLASRLRASTAVHINMPDEDMVRSAYRKLFQDRGLLVDDKVLEDIALRTERSFAAVMAVTDAIDEAALTIKRRVTIPFVQGLGLFG